MTRIQPFARMLGAAAAFGLWACSGPAPTDATQNLDRGARLVLTVTREAPAGYISSAPPEVKASMEQQGYVFRDTEFDYPPTPLVGRYLKVGQAFISIGVDGEFFIPRGTEVSGPVQIFNELSDAQPMGSVDIASSLSPSSAPLKTVVFRMRAGPLASAARMDTEAHLHGAAPGHHSGGRSLRREGASCHGALSAQGTSRAVVMDGCKRVDCSTTVNDPAVGCCLDFDVSKGRITAEEGEDGDGKAPGPCTAKRVWEYLGTVCDQWVRSNVCLLEQATGLGPFGCYRTHRYRYCQFLNENEYGVGVPAVSTVQVGDTLTMPVTNNTPANETLVSISGDANGTVDATDGVVLLGGRQVRIDHYDESVPTHVKIRNMVYRAPDSLPDGVTEAYDTLVFVFWGKTRTITVRVVQKCKPAQGSQGLSLNCLSIAR